MSWDFWNTTVSSFLSFFSQCPFFRISLLFNCAFYALHNALVIMKFIILMNNIEYSDYYDPVYLPSYYPSLFETEQSVCQRLLKSLCDHSFKCSSCDVIPKSSEIFDDSWAYIFVIWILKCRFAVSFFKFLLLTLSVSRFPLSFASTLVIVEEKITFSVFKHRSIIKGFSIRSFTASCIMVNAKFGKLFSVFISVICDGLTISSFIEHYSHSSQMWNNWWYSSRFHAWTFAVLEYCYIDYWTMYFISFTVFSWSIWKFYCDCSSRSSFPRAFQKFIFVCYLWRSL